MNATNRNIRKKNSIKQTLNLLHPLRLKAHILLLDLHTEGLQHTECEWIVKGKGEKLHYRIDRWRSQKALQNMSTRGVCWGMKFWQSFHIHSWKSGSITILLQSFQSNSNGWRYSWYVLNVELDISLSRCLLNFLSLRLGLSCWSQWAKHSWCSFILAWPMPYHFADTELLQGGFSILDLCKIMFGNLNNTVQLVVGIITDTHNVLYVVKWVTKSHWNYVQ